MRALQGSPNGSPVAVLTRPAAQSVALTQTLQQAGWQVADWPALALATVPASALPDVAGFDLVVFVSGNAVRHFAAQRDRFGVFGWPAQLPVAVVGPASAAAVAAVFPGAQVIQPPAQSLAFDSEALWAELGRRALRPKRVLIVRGGAGAEGEGRGWLAAQWRRQGAGVTLHAAYSRQAATWPQARLTQVGLWRAQARPVSWLWSSTHGVQAVAGQWGAKVLARAWCGSRVLVTHERVAATVQALAQQANVTVFRPGSGSQQACAAAVPHDALVLQVCLPHDAAILAAFVQ